MSFRLQLQEGRSYGDLAVRLYSTKTIKVKIRSGVACCIFSLASTAESRGAVVVFLVSIYLTFAGEFGFVLGGSLALGHRMLCILGTGTCINIETAISYGNLALYLFSVCYICVEIDDRHFSRYS